MKLLNNKIIGHGNFNLQDIDENPVKICHAKICFCSQPEGRAYHKEHGLWDILICKSCGSKGIHAKCGGLEVDVLE